MEKRKIMVEVEFTSFTDARGLLVPGKLCHQKMSINGEVVFEQSTVPEQFVNSEHPLRLLERFACLFPQGSSPGEITENLPDDDLDFEPVYFK